MTETYTAQRQASRELAAFVSALEYSDVSDDVVELTERCFVDTVGVTLAGATVGAGSLATGPFLDRLCGSGDVTVFGREESASVTNAVFANGTAAHSLDFDDISSAINGHPSACLVPSILAVSETVDASGAEAITAYVAGFEVANYLASPLNPSHYEHGWHATATFGTFGVAAAVASLLDLDASQARHALNLVASTAAGLKANFGSMAKPMHVGQAAQSGIKAALLAADGFTAADGAIDGPGGFFELYSGGDGFELDCLSDPGPGTALVEAGVDVKKYPCCSLAQSSIGAAVELRNEKEINPADVKAAEIVASRGARDVLRYDDPDTGAQAKFSLPYTFAWALDRGNVGLETFEDDNINDADVQSLRESVTFTVDRDLPYTSHAATVRVDMVDGESFKTSYEQPPGFGPNQLSTDELRAKFMTCATQVLDEETAGTLYSRAQSLSTLENCSELPDLVTP